MLRRIQVAGGPATPAGQFYTALYHALLYPSVFSDDNGQYTGHRRRRCTRPRPGHAAIRELLRLGHLPRPGAAGRDGRARARPATRSRRCSTTTRQTGQLPKWGLDNGETYVQVGDPADPIIADAYAFGARDFDTSTALTDMIAEATTPNNIRPGLATLGADGYLPDDGTYGCCNFYGPVSTQLEYDTADYAIAVAAPGHSATRADYRDVRRPGAGLAERLQRRRPATCRPEAGRRPRGCGGFYPGHAVRLRRRHLLRSTRRWSRSISHGLIAARGGDAAWHRYLDGLLSNLTEPGPRQRRPEQRAEPGHPLGVRLRRASPTRPSRRSARMQAGAVLRHARRAAGQRRPGHDERLRTCGTSSGWYPETPGTGALALASPAFPRASCACPAATR